MLPPILNCNPTCQGCELHEFPHSVCIPTRHYPPSLELPGAPLILFIGQNPGYYEDQKNEPFVGKSGDLVKRVFIGGTLLHERASIWLGNGVRCHTEANDTPKPKHYKACNHYLLDDLQSLFCQVHDEDQVKIVVTLGAPATTSFYKNVVEEGTIPLTKAFTMNGREYEFLLTGDTSTPFRLFSTYHPAAVLRNNNLINSGHSHMQMVSDCLDGTMATPSDPTIVPTRSPRYGIQI